MSSISPINNDCVERKSSKPKYCSCVHVLKMHEKSQPIYQRTNCPLRNVIFLDL